MKCLMLVGISVFILGFYCLWVFLFFLAIWAFIFGQQIGSVVLTDMQETS